MSDDLNEREQKIREILDRFIVQDDDGMHAIDTLAEIAEIVGTRL